MHTNDIEKSLFLFSTSLKKIYPSITLKIGIIKYPKLASIILLVAIAYIQMPQLIKINNPEKNKKIKFNLFLIILKKISHFEKRNVVIIKVKDVHKHLCTTSSTCPMYVKYLK